jgi:hypothetical protein
MSIDKPSAIDLVRVKRTDEIVNAIKESIVADNSPRATDCRKKKN